MQLVLVAVVISFVFWYATPQGQTTTVVAEVNGEPIMETEFRNLYTGVQNEQERNLGRGLTNPEESDLRERVRQQLIELEVVRQEAEALGIEVSEYEVAREILSIPGIQNEEGGLDRERYERFLQRQGLTEAVYEARTRDRLLYNKMAELVSLGTTLSEPVLRRTYEQSQRKIDLTYVRIRPSAFYSSIEVDDAQLKAWHEANEGRAQETYDKDFDRLYKHPEQLHVSMIRMAITDDEAATLLPKMNAIREQLDAGAYFAELARKWSEHPTAENGGDMGKKSTLQLSVEVTDGVADLKAGDISRVISSDADLRIYKLHERVDPYEDAFEDVKDKIAERLIREEKAPAMAIEFAENTLLPKWKETGEVPTELLTEKMLSSQSTGLVPAGAPSNPFGPPADLMSAASSASEGEVLPKVFENDGVYWVGQVTQKQEADLSQFEANREQIRESELFRHRQTVFQNWVADAVARADVN
jgi:peptidyl-prolyl cis-trans isomerase D